MPHFDIIRRISPKETFRVASVMGTYDLQTNKVEEHFTGDINLPEKWNIGLIVGRSGTGKTTIASELFGKYIRNFEYKAECVLDDFPKDASMREIEMALTSVGFASPPSWLKPYAVLSNGEKMRCDIARCMCEKDDMIVFDEFTSVVDREVAKVSSFAIQKAIRRSDGKFVAVSCHDDIANYLMPDWVFNTDTMTFQCFDFEEQKKNRGRFQMRIYQINGKKDKELFWRMFGKYHYLSHVFNYAAKVWVATINGRVAALYSALPFPHPKKKNYWRGHRMVVMPDYQGIGVATRLTEFVGHVMKKNGKGFFNLASHIAMIKAWEKSPKWKCTRLSRVSTGSNNGIIHNKHVKGSTSSARITAAFEYIGD